MPYDQQVATVVDIARLKFDQLSGGEDVITEESLHAALSSDDPEVRAAAQWLLDNDSARFAMDVGDDEGDVDGKISKDDLDGFAESLEDEDIRELLADTAQGDGDNDDHISEDDLRAMIADESLPQAYRDWAQRELDSGRYHEEEGCGWNPVCHVSHAAESAWDATEGAREWVGGAAVWTAKLGQKITWMAGVPIILPGQFDDYLEFRANLGRGVLDWTVGTAKGLYTLGKFAVERQINAYSGLLHGDWKSFLATQTGVDLIQYAPQALDAGEAIVTGLARQVDTCATGSASDSGRACGSLAMDVASVVVPGGIAAKGARTTGLAADVAERGRAVALADRGADAVALTERNVTRVLAEEGDDAARLATRNPDEFVGMCFTAGTLVRAAGAMVPIETVRVGERVVSLGDDGELTPTEVDSSWQRVEVAMPDPAGSGDVFAVELLRPASWVDDVRAAVGASISVVLPQMGVTGSAVVTAIGEAPAIEAGPGHVVLATIRSTSTRVLEIRFEQSDVVLEPTASHPLYSLDRAQWVRAGDLRVGERLRTETSSATIASIDHKAGAHHVFNFEVESTHSYLVSELALYSHNDNPCAAAGAGGRLPRNGYQPSLGFEEAFDVANGIYQRSSGLQALTRLYERVNAGAITPQELEVALRDLGSGIERKYGVRTRFVSNDVEIPNLSRFEPGARGGNYATFVESERTFYFRSELYGDPQRLVREYAHEYSALLITEYYQIPKAAIPRLGETQYGLASILNDVVRRGGGVPR